MGKRGAVNHTPVTYAFNTDAAFVAGFWFAAGHSLILPPKDEVIGDEDLFWPPF